jgi:hypothetical protein
MNVAMIESLIVLVFHLLGRRPDHWNKRFPYRDEHWRLDSHRTVCYTQTDDQKARLIIDSINMEKLGCETIDGYKNLHEVLYLKFRSRAADFIDWFKKTYPEMYCEMF